MGLNLMTLGSWPEPKSRVRCSTDRATQVPQSVWFFFLNKIKPLLWNNCRFTEKFQRWSREFHVPLSPFPLLLTSDITMVELSKLRNQLRYMTINWTPDFIRISPAFPLMSFFWSRIQSRISRGTLSSCLLGVGWSTPLSPSFHGFHDLNNFKESWSEFC